MESGRLSRPGFHPRTLEDAKQLGPHVAIGAVSTVKGRVSILGDQEGNISIGDMFSTVDSCHEQPVRSAALRRCKFDLRTSRIADQGRDRLGPLLHAPG